MSRAADVRAPKLFFLAVGLEYRAKSAQGKVCHPVFNGLREERRPARPYNLLRSNA
jgi:hypothetical protein